MSNYRVLVIAVLCFFCIQVVKGQLPHYVSGATLGQFNSTDQGSATYSIPIKVCPGTAGLAPKLSLTYTSNGPNSLVGVGWTIQGLSQINTGRKTLSQDNPDIDNYYDGTISKVGTKSTDVISGLVGYRYFLDGERLVLAEEPTVNDTFNLHYGRGKRSYYTEQFNFSKITVTETFFTAEGTPNVFEVKSKDGLTHEYGTDDSSRLAVSDFASPSTWLIRTTKDTKGNYIKYHYDKLDPIQYYPSYIEYTGNENTGMLPYNRIEFIYEYRPDGFVQRSYQGGTTAIIGQRLKEIDVYNENRLFRRYVLEYTQSSLNNHSLLHSVTECDSSNNCFKPIVFEYTDNDQLDFSKRSLSIPNPLQASGLTFPGNLDNQLIQGDWDNNGLIDYLSYSPTKKKYQFSIHDTKVDTIYNIDYQGLDLSSFNASSRLFFYPVDIQSDGKTDLLIVDPDAGYYRLFVNRTNTVGTNQNFYNFIIADTTRFNLPKDLIKDDRFTPLFTDWNKDGLTDIVYYNYKAYSQQPTFYFFKNKSIDYTNSTPGNFQLERKDLDLPLVLGHDYVFDFADYSNDGLPDIIAWDKSSKDFHLFVKASDTGVIYNEHASMGVSFAGAPGTTAITSDDYDNDGITDIFIFDTETGANKLIRRNNNGTASDYSNIVNTALLKGVRSVTPYDLNSNGLIDLFITTNNNLYYLKDIVTQDPAVNFTGIDVSDVLLRNPAIPGRFTIRGPVDLLFYNSLNNKSAFYSLTGSTRNLMSKITNSNLAVTDITYTDLINGENNDVNYPKPAYPLGVYFSGMPVLNTVKVDNGVGGQNTTKYQFFVPYYNLEGRGFRGFLQTVAIDSARMIKNIRQNNIEGLLQTDPASAKLIHKFTGAPLQFNWAESFDPSSANIRLTEDNYKCAFKTYFKQSAFSYTQQTITSVYEVFPGNDGTTVIPTVKRVSYDDYGNILTEVTDYGDGQVDSLVNVYNNDLNNWYLGRLVSSTRFAVKTGHPTIVRKSAFEYDFLTGLLIKETLYPDSSDHIRLVKEYLYDGFGNVIRSQETSWNGSAQETRFIETTYDQKGRFVIITKNALGQIQIKDIETRIGKPLKETSPNGISNTAEFDDLGRPIKEIYPDGNWASVRYLDAADTTNVPANCSYLEIHESSSNPPEYKYFDKLDRLIQTVTIGFGGKKIIKTTQFDYRGYIISETEPYFEGEAANATLIKYKYDYRGRLIEVNKPFKGGTATDRITYRNKQRVLTNAAGQTKTENYDNKDHLIEVIDNAGNSLTYEYNAAGALIKTTDPKGNNIICQYDGRGMQTSSKDPDMGTHLYLYNGFGEIIQQIDSKGDTLSLTYDVLGRIKQKRQKEGNITFTYDQQSNGVGKIASVSGLNGYKFEVLYDNFGRKIVEKETIEGKLFQTTIAYNNLGKQSSLQYPGGLKINYTYDNAGFLTKVFRQSDNYTIWNALKINAKGQLEQYTLGNNTSTTRYIDNQSDVLDSAVIRKQNGTRLQAFGYRFNNIGQLTQRSNSLNGKVEEFAYDELNRLIMSKLNTGKDSVKLSYDATGNIIYKSDVGFYSYGDVNSGPHQVIQIALDNKICVPGFNIATTYSSMGKVSKIEKDSLRMEVYYNGADQRCVQKLFVHDTLVSTKYYIGNSYEYTIKKDTISEASFIRDYEGVIAVYYRNNKVGTQFQYLGKDHIGSTTLITDSLANVVSVLSYDAWGKRRKSDWTYNTDSTLSLIYQRGFTGHEHYDLFDIIDMNGRIYDAVLGRFLSADPNISDIEDLQSFNRYSYVLNDPLTLTDPSGYFSLGGAFRSIASAFASVVKAVVNVQVGYYKLQWKYRKEIAIAVIIIASAGSAAPAVIILSGAAVGFISGFETTIQNGGSLNDALSAGFTGAVIGGISAGVGYGLGAAVGELGAQGLTQAGCQVVASGLRDGVVESLQGGSFEHGFMQGIKREAIRQAASYATSYVGDAGGHETSFDNVIYKSVAHGVVQGISAKLSGGQFKDGFIAGASTSASQLLINDAPASSQLLLSALVGGTASQLSGGKFANGAASGIMIRLYNDDDYFKKVRNRVEIEKLNIQEKAYNAVYRIFFWESSPSHQAFREKLEQAREKNSLDPRDTYNDQFEKAFSDDN